MTVTRHHLVLTTDTGANASTVSGTLNGQLEQISYYAADTGVRADTGAVVTMQLDTGEGGPVLSVFHLVPNGTSWMRHIQAPMMDTGGAITATSYLPFALAGEKVKVSVQGLATDTGKEVHLHLYTRQ
jgi:hypothetical protein